MHIDNIHLKNQFNELLAAFNLKYDDIVLEKDSDIDYGQVFPQEKISFLKEFKQNNFFKNQPNPTQ